MPFIANWDPYHVVYSDFEFTSGSIQTKARFPIAGKFEARIKLPSSQGLWPAFWLYSEYYGGVYNEIDIFEVYNEEPEYHLNTNLYYANEGGYAKTYSCTKRNIEGDLNNLSSSFYIYTLIWDEDKIEWYINGNLIRKEPYYFTRIFWGLFGLTVFEHYCGDIKIGKKYRRTKYFPILPMYIMLNTAVQSKKKAPNSSSPFPAQMEVDYVRVYQRKPCKQDVYVSNNINNQYYFGGTKTFYRNFTGRNIDLNCNMNVPINYQVKITAQNSIVFNNGFSLNTGDSTLFLASTQSDLCSSLSLKRIVINNITPYEPEQDDEYDDDTTIVYENMEELYGGIQPIFIYPTLNDSTHIIIDFRDNSFRDISLSIINEQNNVVYLNNKIEENRFLIDLSNYELGTYTLKLIDIVTKKEELYNIEIIE